MRRAAPSAERRPAPVATVLVATGAAVALGAAFVISPDRVEDGPVICPFRRLTGLPCPGCGLTRSWVHLAHGRWDDAFAAHPFGLVAVVATVALVAGVLVTTVRRRPPPDLDAAVRRPWVVAVVAAWLAFSVVRLGLAV